MKLNKKLESEILKVYNTYWDGMLKGNINLKAACLDDDFQIIGSAEGEIFLNKKDAIQFYRATADQIAGKVELRNREIKITPIGELILFTELSDIYILIEDEWVFYSKFRSTSLLKKIGNSWKFVQLHASIPDSKTEKGEQLSFEKIQKENIELRDAVKRRTIELEQKNRELEIEASLERIRAVAMGMDKSGDLLKICEVSFKEFRKLGFGNLRNAIIHIHNDEKRFFMDYDFSDYLGGAINKISYDAHPIVENYLKQIKKADDAFAEIVIERSQLDGWKDFRRRGGQQDDPRLDNIPVLYYYLYSIGVGDIGISTFQPIEESQIKILKRFRNVFDLAYRRFTDIAQAEAQAREAEVQLALERVRARTMAMHHSEELLEAGKLLYEELRKLGIESLTSGYVLIDDERKIGWSYLANPADGTIMTNPFGIPHNETEVMRGIASSWEKQEPYSFIELDPQATRDHQTYIAKHTINFKLSVDELLAISPEKMVRYNFNFKHGYLLIITGKLLAPDQIEIMLRCTKVFEMTYLRFLDLKKAEAQAREAQIEAALERVRSRTMGMQKSEELKEVIQLVYEQFVHLKINVDHAGFVVDYTPKGDWHFWIADQQEIPSKITHPYFDSVWAHQFNEAKEKGIDFFATNLNFEEKNKFYQDLFKFIPGVPEESLDFYFNCPGLAGSTVLLDNVGLYIENFSGIPYTDEENSTLMRFGKVFQQTYTRFLDLQKAEAQAREAQIEAALERIRSRALGMHHSSEVGEVSNLLFSEFERMNINLAGFNIIVLDKEKDRFEMWRAKPVAIPNEFESFSYKVMNEKLHHYIPNLVTKFESAWKSGKDYFSHVFTGEERMLFLRANMEIYSYSDEQLQKMEQLYPDPIYWYMAFFKQGWLGIIRRESLSNRDLIISHRFAEVFEFAYTRFLDLQKAEERVHEAKIEAALERVRNRTIAMQHSDEFSETAGVLFEQFVSLGIVPKRCAIGIIDQTKESAKMWFTSSEGKVVLGADLVPLNKQENLINLYEAWQNDKEHFYFKIQGQKRVEWTSYMVNKVKMHLPEYRPDTIDRNVISNEPAVFNNFFFTHGFIMLHTAEELQELDIPMLKRFAGVFEQTYTRFLDLKNAEAQARESQIEASLEKVRARAMAMHSSEDLSAAVNVFFKELKTLGLVPRRCGVAIIDESTHTAYNMLTTATSQGDSFEITGEANLDSHPLLTNVLNNWKDQKEYFPVLKGDEISEYYRVLRPQVAVTDFADTTQCGYYIPFNEGVFYVWTDKNLEEDKLRICRKFTSVIGLTYRRFLDLKEAEARAFEAVRRSSLDRVRAEIASMRTAEDLRQITPIVWRELTALGVPFIRCGVFIVDEETKKVQVYLTTPDGKSLGVLNLSFDATKLIMNTVNSWRKTQVYKEHWNKEQFIKWTKSMMSLGQVQNAETYQGSANPPESLHLHFIPFTQGMLYVGDVSPLTDEKLELVKTLAEAFSIAYARYEDFKNLEEAKNKMEKTLTELKAAQAQLVHSEKMASLGELTAGIAHEIKNPLNFVNNFSEVSGELLEEMKTELQNKNEEEVAELIEDLKQNLEKINQHGKRADSIVKGMLLHSRGTSGEKTLTDINDLLDQYVNLAYHGMRAQNKEFNITIEKDYDKTLEKISVVPQDISRAFLNIINNACYTAYDRKKKSEDNNFSPTLKISTKNLNNKVEIRIGDNGNGIPADILDKIFQPFFTTKPTGEGTGLGLSLSYDIITKVHDGELKVDTKEGEGTIFIILLTK